MSRDPPLPWSRRHAISIGVGVVALVLLGLVVVTPGLLRGVVGPAPTEISAARARIIAGALLGGAVVVWLLSASSRLSTVEPLVPVGPETIHGRETDRIGAEFDARVESALDRRRGGSNRDQIKQRLRTLVVDLYATQIGCSHETAVTAVDDGVWTDDRRAAAFVSDDQPLPFRLQAWDALRPGHPVQRRLERTVVAVEALAEDREGRT